MLLGYNHNMWIAYIVLMLVACLALAAALCFVKRQSQFFIVLSCLFYAALICTGVCCASYHNTFNGYSILIFLSVLPLLLTLFKLKGAEQDELSDTSSQNTTLKNAAPKSASMQNLSSNNFSTQNAVSQNARLAQPATQSDDKINKLNAKTGKKSTIFAANWTAIMRGAAYAISAFCVAFCSLYVGKESPYGLLMGIALGLGLTFLHFILTKQNLLQDPWGFVANSLLFLAVGMLFSSILPALLYSLALDNILFSVGCVAYCVYLLLETYLPSKFNHLALAAAYLLLFATIVF